MADITKLNINGTDYNIKDEIVRGLVTTLQNEGYIKASDIIDVLTSTNANVPLSANQGRELNATKIDNITISGNILRFTANGNTIGSIELPTLTTNQSTQLNTAYNHSQSTHAPSNAEANVQSDWNVTDTNSDAYIANKPTNVSAFVNDSDFVNSVFVINKISEASLSGGEVDLSGYVTKETGNANQITFADGQTFQAKLEAGTLKGEKGEQGIQGIQGLKGDKGDKGDTGQDGLTTTISVNGTTYTHSNGTITLPNYPTVVSTANGITIADTAGNFTATNVEGALAELFQFVSNGKSLIASAITDMGIATSNTDSFEVMANNIRMISGGSGEITTHTITNNLTNCTNNNNSVTVSNNSSYSATITANTGYTISSITVTMGEIDITSSAVNGNNINIPSVTGNIVITVNTSVSESGRDLATTILNMQYASAHEALPNAPIDDVWKDKPRQGKGSTIPTQNCTECASGTHTASESYSAGSLWSTFGQWATIYKIKDTNLVENVGVEITDFKMWRYNENTNQWVLVNDTFDYGAFYYETFWDDGSAPLNDHKILSSDKKTYKCLMDSQTNGRCFHPFSAQKKWSDYGFTTNPSYIVVQMKARLIVWDENGADNRASANLCMNVGGDYWIRQGASFDDQWRHNGDMMVGYYKKITNDWRYVYMTTCPNTWDKGFPCDSAIDSGSGGTTSNPIELTLASTMTCTKGEVFNITYNTNIEAVKHEMSWDGGTTYIDITSDIIADGTNYIYTHEAINDATWNPVSRYIRVTDVNGNTSSGSISITINEEPSSGGTTDKIQLNLASTMNCTKGEAFNITYSTNIKAVKHEMSWDGGSTYSEIEVTSDGTNYTYTHEAISDTTWNPVSRWIRVTDANGNVSTSSISITIDEPTVSSPIELTLASTMTCTKDVAFSITYSTNIEAVKHEMSWDGGSTYYEIYPSSSGTNYTYTHEAITDATWNPVSRYIRVTDVNGNVSTSSISITING